MLHNYQLQSSNFAVINVCYVVRYIFFICTSFFNVSPLCKYPVECILLKTHMYTSPCGHAKINIFHIYVYVLEYCYTHLNGAIKLDATQLSTIASRVLCQS